MIGDPDFLHSDACRRHLAFMEKAHYEANRRALLEHARMGRSVPQCKGDSDVIVWVTPAEIFAIYGFDEFGRPMPGTPQE